MATAPGTSPGNDGVTRPMPLPLGGRYQLLDLLGRGGMAEVYRAADTRLSRQVAVKLLRDGSGEPSDHDRFIAEARTLAALSHSGLVTVFDAGFGDGRAFLAMELVEGPTLAALLAEGPMPTQRLGAIAAQVAEALAYVHAHGVIHRDVKPANVLIDHEDRAKLADFGIARLVESTVRHTRPDQAIGTAAYLSPEQVRGTDVDASTDVYSLGLLLLEGLTGRRAFDGPATESALVRLHRSPDVPGELPSGWRELLTAMTALERDARPPAAEVAATLRSGLGRPAPRTYAGVADATTAPILAGNGDGEPNGTIPPPPTYPPPAARPLADMTTAHVPVPPSQRYGEAARARARKAAAWARGVPPHLRAIAAGLGVLLLFLVVVAIAGQDSEPPPIPDNTPAELRGPLQDLHEAVDDTEAAPELAERLGRVDDAIASGDLARARSAGRDLAAATTDALLADEISDDQAGDVLEAAKALLAQLPQE